MRIGNDIVDLRASLGHHPRFARRILSEDEFSRIAPGDERALWTHWAAKEAAYKAHCQGGRIPFSPPAWELAADGQSVRFLTNVFALRLESEGDCIFAVATDADLAHVLSAQTVFLIPPDGASEKAEVRRLALALGQQALQLPASEFALRFEAGIPHLWVPSRSLRLPLSFTHHGCFAACSLLTPPA